MIGMNEAAPAYAQDVAAVAAKLRQHPGPIVVLSHENPDGDALGSVLGLTRALRALGKTVIAPMDVPRYLRFLPGPGELSPPLAEWPAGALVAVLDVDNNDPARVAGADLSTFTGEVVNVDHHGTNARRAAALVVDPGRPATAMMVADVVDALCAPWSEAIATPLMLGLSTDTGSFRFDSVTPETFEAAARLRAHGARLGWINDQLGQNPRTYYLLLREVLSTMEFLHGGRVVLARVDDAMVQRAGASWEDVESYVSLLRGAEGSVLAVMVKDFGDRVKLSLRSRGDVSAQNIAVALGGGGHVPAAGATLALPYAEVRPLLDQAITAELARVDAAQAGA
ncbi:bifunctional oligoribonuclease/PAP phosphatase NrnA [Deinococcus metallilatus]|uniref:Bifunctional oligoribonuclease/PAP phosphatase NrnA n=1 Tax=Deinococcus metallilatus TaxID=1211322 RepID=A0AAJ5F2N1_9DEIO|nr:bifunctional oligoribonuclease/PAP phosphatase NrnA [Deinococcus metallilatus]MBB5295170.1 phosphoesterase RecJ-like protein [Deinococcus metallilatus]QBY08661.1 bifunctional oligoribonuclease/PAP phosphatase NrnA [Deinococcus metallilatus]RXJ10540.1 bifunctional oligoribonuclease/PAP phosphatase NrnA [Deinococcus metallilatus]TLK26511.1 bifunctional oligoribonuclease/PAP phosphatase NrnA [Deinococcus metallilatus]GMA14943.1 phosphoesterase [Deinococcus metallilatus]